jgi:iron complex transport system substrate-binding protein
VRIVSLLPSTTEILFGIGAGDDVVGVTFECDHPVEARTRTIVSTSAMPHGLPPAEIDAYVAEAMRRGEDLYRLDEGALAGLDADLVVTQDLCAVCAVDVSVVDEALAHLGCRAEVLTIDPHTLEEVLASVGTLGKATGTEPAAGTPDARSVRVTWDDVRAADPEVVVCAPCGYGLAASVALAREVADSRVLPDGVPLWAVDANASFARPGPRLVDGVEALASILHPGAVEDSPIARRVR